MLLANRTNEDWPEKNFLPRGGPFRYARVHTKEHAGFLGNIHHQQIALLSNDGHTNRDSVVRECLGINRYPPANAAIVERKKRNLCAIYIAAIKSPSPSTIRRDNKCVTGIACD